MANQLPGATGLIRRVAVTAAAAGVAIVLAGCAAGQNAQTVNQKPPIDAASATAGDVAIRSAAIVASNGGDSYAKGGTAMVQFVVINTGAQPITLTGVSTPAAASAVLSTAGLPDSGASASSDSASPSTSASSSGSASTSASTSPSATGSGTPATSSSAPSSTPIVIGVGQSMEIGFSAVGANVLLNGLTEPLYPAQPVPVTFSFATGNGQGAPARTIQATLPVQLNSNPPSAPVISEATQPGNE